MKVAQSCLTLWDPLDYTVHGILQARILEWVAISFSRESSQPRDRTQISPIAGRFLPAEPQRKPKNTGVGILFLLQWSSWPRNWTRIACIAGRSFTNWAIRDSMSNVPVIHCCLINHPKHRNENNKHSIIVMIGWMRNLSKSYWTVFPIHMASTGVT